MQSSLISKLLLRGAGVWDFMINCFLQSIKVAKVVKGMVFFCVGVFNFNQARIVS